MRSFTSCLVPEAAGEIAFRVSEVAPDVVKSLKTPIRRLAAKNVAFPQGCDLEQVFEPQVDDVVTILTWW